MGREEDREGKERRGKRKREEERRGGSEDEGEGGSTTLSDASAHVTSVEEECRVEGEKNRQANYSGRKRYVQVRGIRLSGFGISL